MYYWNLLQKDDTKLVKKVLNIQTLLPSKNDWICQLKIDLEECDIRLSEIKNMKKEKFKTLVKKKIKNLAKEYLINLRSKHSKSDKLMHTNECKDYLKTESITVLEKKLLFSLKTRQVQWNTGI